MTEKHYYVPKLIKGCGLCKTWKELAERLRGNPTRSTPSHSIELANFAGEPLVEESVVMLFPHIERARIRNLYGPLGSLFSPGAINQLFGSTSSGDIGLLTGYMNICKIEQIVTDYSLSDVFKLYMGSENRSVMIDTHGFTLYRDGSASSDFALAIAEKATTDEYLAYRECVKQALPDQAKSATLSSDASKSTESTEEKVRKEEEKTMNKVVSNAGKQFVETFKNAARDAEKMATGRKVSQFLIKKIRSLGGTHYPKMLVNSKAGRLLEAIIVPAVVLGAFKFMDAIKDKKLPLQEEIESRVYFALVHAVQEGFQDIYTFAEMIVTGLTRELGETKDAKPLVESFFGNDHLANAGNTAE